jgi:hypothetical protein
MLGSFGVRSLIFANSISILSGELQSIELFSKSWIGRIVDKEPNKEI